MSRLEALRGTGIFGFISNRWAEAKEDLALIDPMFVASLDAWKTVQDKGLISPDSLPASTKRLSDLWYRVLEAGTELLRQMDRTLNTADKFSKAHNHAEAIYYQDTHAQDLFGLCEKVTRLIEYSCGLNGLGRREDKYRDQVDSIGEHVGKAARHGLVHGAPGGGGRPSEGLTDDDLWEVFVGLGDDLLPYLLDSTEGDIGPAASLALSATAGYFNQLGEILLGLDEDIKRTRVRK